MATPSKVTAVTATPGPGAGEVTFHWTSAGSHTTSFHLETALTSFKVGDPRLPDHGRDSHIFAISPSKRSITLTATQLSHVGASVSSANHLYYRFKAVNHTSKGTVTRPWPYQQTVAVKPAAPASSGPSLKVASFNVRTATVTTDGHPWLKRVSLVAAQILAKSPGIVTLQELGPGRADGKKATTDPSSIKSMRQTETLTHYLGTQGGSRYKLVRSTPYIKPGTTEGSQGARILYDSSKYRVVSSCPETTDGHAYSSSCTIKMPIRKGDHATDIRRAAYAELEDVSSGARFYVVSVHLDPRDSSKTSTEKSLEALRAHQMDTVTAKIRSIDSAGHPIVLSGDLNSYQNNQHGFRAHDELVKAGYYDTAAAQSQVDVHYATFNDFAKTIAKSPSGWGARLDVIAVKGVKGADSFENVMKVTSSNRPSDHNMIVSTFHLGNAS